MQAVHAQFLSHFQHGMMKPNRYLIEFNLPQGIDPGSPSISSLTLNAIETVQRATNLQLNARGGVNIKCHTAMFPQRSMQTTELKQNTNPYRVPYSVMYDPVTFSFYSDSRGDARRFFDIWQQAAVNVDNHTMNFYDEFVSHVTMSVLNEANQKTYSVRLFEAYPISVGAMDVSYSQANNFQTVLCTLNYRYWKEVPISSNGIVTVGDLIRTS